MANEYTVASGAPLEDIVQTAYSKATELAFQPNLYFAQFAQAKKWDVRRGDPMPGDTVTFTIYDNLSPATSELSDEYSDVTRVPMAETQKSIALKEYGNVVTLTNKLRVLAFDNIDLAAAKVVGHNMASSVDLIARAAYDAQVGGDYATYAGGGTTPSGIGAGDIVTAEIMRKIYNKLERANVPKLDGGFYAAVMHPDVIFDLKNEGYGTAANTGTWRAPREYVAPEAIFNGEIGEFEGFRIVSTSNARIQSEAGSGTTDVYTTYFLGYQAVAYAEGIKPDIRITGPFDNLGRTLNVGWYALAGYGELRPGALHNDCGAAALAN